jgi:hypothetical protein
MYFGKPFLSSFKLMWIIGDAFSSHRIAYVH